MQNTNESQIPPSQPIPPGITSSSVPTQKNPLLLIILILGLLLIVGVGSYYLGKQNTPAPKVEPTVSPTVIPTPTIVTTRVCKNEQLGIAVQTPLDWTCTTENTLDQYSPQGAGKISLKSTFFTINIGNYVLPFLCIDAKTLLPVEDSKCITYYKNSMIDIKYGSVGTGNDPIKKVLFGSINKTSGVWLYITYPDSNTNELTPYQYAELVKILDSLSPIKSSETGTVSN